MAGGALLPDMPAEDPEYDQAEESLYECLDCGTTVESENATSCPNCGGVLRNKSLPME